MVSFKIQGKQAGSYLLTAEKVITISLVQMMILISRSPFGVVGVGGPFLLDELFYVLGSLPAQTHVARDDVWQVPEELPGDLVDALGLAEVLDVDDVLPFGQALVPSEDFHLH